MTLTETTRNIRKKVSRKIREFPLFGCAPVLLLSCVSVMYAQGWLQVFGGPDDDEFTAVAVYDTLVIVGGNTESFGNGQQDWWVGTLGKTTGNPIWFQTVGGTSMDELYDIAVQLSTGNFLLSGEVNSQAGGGSASNDVQLALFSIGGNLLWSTRIPHNYAWDVWHIYSDTMPGGNFLIWGDIRGRTGWGLGLWDSYYFQIGASGGPVSFHSAYGNPFTNEGIHDMRWDFTTGVRYLLQWVFGVGAGSADFLLSAIGPGGTPLWQRTYGTSALEVPWRLLTSAGSQNFWLVGWTFAGSVGFNDALLLQVSSVDGTLWQAIAAGTPSADERIHDALLRDSILYLAGYTTFTGSRDALLMAIDLSSLTVLWAYAYGGAGDEEFVALTSDGSLLYAVGYTTSWGAGGRDGLVMAIPFSGVLPCGYLAIPVELQPYPVQVTTPPMYHVSPPYQQIPGPGSTGISVSSEYSCITLSLVELRLNADPREDGMVSLSWEAFLPGGPYRVWMERFVSSRLSEGEVLWVADPVYSGYYEGTWMDSSARKAKPFAEGSLIYRMVAEDLVSGEIHVSPPVEVPLSEWTGEGEPIRVLLEDRQFWISGPPGNFPMEVEVWMASGRKVYHTQIVERTLNLSHLHLPSGVYWIRFIHPEWTPASFAILPGWTATR